MFFNPNIPTISHKDTRSNNIRDLGNVDYYKRYIIIEKPDFRGESEITVVNISSFTGGDKIGIMGRHERYQNTYIYHCRGNVVFGTVIDINDISNYINYNAMVYVDDVSYSVHDYNLKRMRFGELLTSVSYVDMYDNVEKFLKTPNIRFYNHSHHILNRDTFKIEYIDGKNFIDNSHGGRKHIDSLLLADLVDDHTQVLFVDSCNYSNINHNGTNMSLPEMYLSKDGYMIDNFNGMSIDMMNLLIIGPVTELVLGLLYNSASFIYDTKKGLYDINYSTEHKLTTNSLYRTQIESNSITTFNIAMEYIVENIDYDFRLFVHSELSKLTIRFTKYTKFGNSEVKDFKYDIGKFRNNQHFDAVHWTTDFNCNF